MRCICPGLCFFFSSQKEKEKKENQSCYTGKEAQNVQKILSQRQETMRVFLDSLMKSSAIDERKIRESQALVKNKTYSLLFFLPYISKERLQRRSVQELSSFLLQAHEMTADLTWNLLHAVYEKRLPYTLYPQERKEVYLLEIFLLHLEIAIKKNHEEVSLDLKESMARIKRYLSWIESTCDFSFRLELHSLSGHGLILSDLEKFRLQYIDAKKLMYQMKMV